MAVLLTELLETARNLAEEVLLPSAASTDRAERVPEEHLQRLARAGLFGVAGPAPLGIELEMSGFHQLVEVLASGCLATTFVWIQHHVAVLALRGTENSALSRDWLAELCSGRRRAGLALGGLRAGATQLRAEPAPQGWRLHGAVPWVTGWGLVDGVLTWALAPAAQLVTLLLDARASATLQVTPLELVAANASCTVELRFHAHFVPAERVLSLAPFVPPPAHDGGGRSNGSLALGVARRCCLLLGPGPFDAELAARRAQLDAADERTLADARAAAAELALRASAALLTTQGSSAILAGQHAQRLAREALFLLVFGSRPAIRAGLLARLQRTGLDG